MDLKEVVIYGHILLHSYIGESESIESAESAESAFVGIYIQYFTLLSKLFIIWAFLREKG